MNFDRQSIKPLLMNDMPATGAVVCIVRCTSAILNIQRSSFIYVDPLVFGTGMYVRFSTH